MSEPEIKPRVDEHGVGWCDAGCPQCSDELDRELRCRLDGTYRAKGEMAYFDGPCPHYARRQAEWIDRLTARVEELEKSLRIAEKNAADFEAMVAESTRDILLEPVLRKQIETRDREIAALREDRERFCSIVDGLLHRLDGLVNRTDPHNGIRWASGHAYVVMKKLRDDLRTDIDDARGEVAG